MSNLTREGVLRLARLSRIACTEDEISCLLKDLEEVLEYVEQLSAVDTEGVPPCYQVIPGIANVLRPDLPVSPESSHFDRDLFLADAPSARAGLICVPPVLKGQG